MKMHKNCCHYICSFWLRYMHQIVCRLGLCPRPTGGAYIAPPDSLAGLGMGTTGNGKEGGEGKRREGRDGRGGEGVPECPNPELASLMNRSMDYVWISLSTMHCWNAVHLGNKCCCNSDRLRSLWTLKITFCTFSSNAIRGHP